MLFRFACSLCVFNHKKNIIALSFSSKLKRWSWEGGLIFFWGGGRVQVILE